jgi:hypothetical protein
MLQRAHVLSVLLVEKCMLVTVYSFQQACLSFNQLCVANCYKSEHLKKPDSGKLLQGCPVVPDPCTMVLTAAVLKSGTAAQVFNDFLS